MRRKSGNMKILLHFNNSYDDETGNNSYTLTQHDLPDGDTFKFNTSPKFGAACLHFPGPNNRISFKNSTGLFNLSKSGNYFIDFWVRFQEITSTQGLLSFYKGDNLVYNFRLNNDGYFSINGKDSRESYSKSPPPLNEWCYMCLNIKNGNITVSQNDGLNFTGEFPGFEADSVMLGGFKGEIDEFCIHEGNYEIKAADAQQYTSSGEIVLSEIGGFGSGSHGGNGYMYSGQINSYAVLTSAGSNKITVDYWNAGKFGVPDAGHELLLHITAAKSSDYSNLGLFEFRKIISVSGNVFTLNKALPAEFDPAKYIIQAVYVPNFAVADVGDLRPATWNINTGGGIVAFRCAGKCDLDGITTQGTGPDLPAELCATNPGLIDRFYIGKGGGVFVAAKTLNVGQSCHLGGTWDADLTTNTQDYTTGQGSDSGAQTGSNLILIAENITVRDLNICTGAPKTGGRGGCCYIARKGA